MLRNRGDAFVVLTFFTTSRNNLCHDLQFQVSSYLNLWAFFCSTIAHFINSMRMTIPISRTTNLSYTVSLRK